MSSSVSSERAFSQGGITTSKRRSRLKGDIELEVARAMGDPEDLEESDVEESSWDGLLIGARQWISLSSLSAEL